MQGEGDESLSYRVFNLQIYNDSEDELRKANMIWKRKCLILKQNVY